MQVHSTMVSGEELSDVVVTVARVDSESADEPVVSSNSSLSEIPDSVEPSNTLTVDAQLMSRGEIRQGGLPKVNGVSEKKANFVLERSRLSIDYQKAWLNIRLTAQHTGVWGQKGNGTLNMYEAWARLHSRHGLFLQLGRQNLSYDDERILGSNDWAMTALTHDALRFGYEGKGHKFHGILAYNQKAENVNGGTIYTTADGSHHQFYGAMDFFYFSAYYGGYTPGLQNLYLCGTYNPLLNLHLSASYHYLSVANKISDAKMTLGHELDFGVSYDLMKEVKISAGYTFMHGTETLEQLQRVKGRNHLHWGWLMVSVNPRIFRTKL